MAGTISIDLFLTLDGVGQAPGGPKEDTEGGFRFGGWQAPLVDETAGRVVAGRLAATDALLREELYDELSLWIHPVVLGEGKKVFPGGARPANLRLLAPPVTATTGAVLLRFAPDGEPATGDMTLDD